MTKYISLLAIIVLFECGVNAQFNKPESSDYVKKEPNKAAKILELIAIFNDAIDAPTKYNAYVKPIMLTETFPKKQNHSKQQYNMDLEKWINDNPSIIDEFLVVRKKTHDELYGPRIK